MLEPSWAALRTYVVPPTYIAESRASSAENAICVRIVWIALARLFTFPASAQRRRRPLRLAAWVGADELDGDDLNIHKGDAESCGAWVVDPIDVLDELHRVVAGRGGGLAHLLIVLRSLEEIVGVLVIVEDLVAHASANPLCMHRRVRLHWRAHGQQVQA